MPDGKTLGYRIGGTHVFGLKRPPDASRGLPMGSMPWISDPFSTASLPGVSCVTGIIYDAGAGPIDSSPVGLDN